MTSGVHNVANRLRYGVKRALRPVLFRHPPIGLAPERLYLWMRALVETRNVQGAVVEIGVAAGGTAAVCDQLLRGIGVDKDYVGIDTFGGFVDDQWDDDERKGTARSERHLFSANSEELVRKIVTGLGSPNIQLRRGDICTISDSQIPETVSACLIDVDLSEPVFVALERVYPRLAPGGIIMVDDCAEATHWKARDGYHNFMEKNALPETYEFGMAIVRRPS